MATTQKLTSAELKELGYEIKKERKPQNWSKTDGSKNAKIKLQQYRDEMISGYRRIMRLADGEFSYNGETYPVTVSEAQRNWIMDKLAELHDATLQALETGSRPKVITEVCPD